MRKSSGAGSRPPLVSRQVILALDGSTRVCGAALVRPDVHGWETVKTRAEVDGRGQAKLLLPMIDEILTEAGLSPSDIGAVVVGVGPGTFTGVRIAVATARALSLALQVPVAGVGTLSALAAAAAVGAEAAALPLLVPVVDARRGQVFFGLYEAAGLGASGGRWVRRGPFAVCDRSALGEVLGALGVGGALVLAEDRDLIGDLPVDVTFAAGAVEAEWLVLGQQLLVEPGEGPEGDRLQPWLATVLREGGRAVPEVVKPIYVRSPDADIHITKMRDPWAESPGSPPLEGTPVT